MHSAIYQGHVLHRRMAPVEHVFQYRMFMMYLDLAELPWVFGKSRLFSASRRAAARFCREDHMGDHSVPLDQAVRDLVEQQTGKKPDGPIRLLTHLRYFGYVFNPVSFYYCFDAEDNFVETIVAEVNNTPWGERHCYVLANEDDEGRDGIKRFRPAKSMHVSPFMPMDVAYDWRFRPPGDHLTVHMANSREGRKLFDATLVLQRREITPRSLARVLIAFPMMTLKVITAIHWQALLLWLKRCPVYDHTLKGAGEAAEQVSGPEALLMERSK
jgi:DUF1365 family protein